MDTTTLKYFITVAQLQHMSKAADELNISQPALSANISKLEVELGIQLFDRQGRNIQLNQFGQQYYQDIIPALAQLELAERHLQQALNVYQNHLNLVAPPMFTFPDLLPCIQRACPDVTLSYLNCTYNELRSKLLSGQVDLCILGRPIPDQGLISTVLYRDEMIMLVPESHPLAGQDSVPLEAFKDDEFADYPGVVSIQSERDELCLQANFVPRVSFEANTMHDIIEVVRHGHHVALIPRKVLERYLLSGIAIVKLKDAHCTNSLRMYTAENNNRKVVADACEAIIRYFSGMK